MYMLFWNWSRPISPVKVRSHMRGRTRAENWLQQKSLHAFTHARSRSGGGAGAKSAPQEMGPTPNFPRPLRNRALQTIIVLKKWQIRPRPLRVCVNIPVVAERECQNPPVSAPQPLCACVNVASACALAKLATISVSIGNQWWHPNGFLLAQMSSSWSAQGKSLRPTARLKKHICCVISRKGHHCEEP